MSKSISFVFILGLLFSINVSAQKVITPATATANDLAHTKINISVSSADSLRSKGLFLYGISAGYNYKSLRFDTKYDFEQSGDELFITEKINPEEEYPEKFFKNGYSALSAYYLRLATVVGLGKSKKVYLVTGPVIDLRVHSRHKDKYFIGKSKNKDILIGNDILDIRTFNAGWRVGVGILNLFTVNYEWAFIDFLRDDWSANTRFNGISFTIGI